MRANGDAILEAISHGLTDHYVIRPSEPPDEQFHQAISGFLLAWAEPSRRAPHTVDVVGYNWSGRAYELREVLERCALPHRFLLADSEEGRAIVNRVRAARLPILVMPDGTVLEDPSDIEIAAASGTAVAPDREQYDLVIVGGGPAGLSAGVYGASEGLHTAAHRRGRPRRSGDVELLDPQLPRVPARRQRWRARPARVRAGLDLRRPIRLHATRHST